MFTYLNSANDQMFFNVELRKVDLSPLKKHEDLRVVSLVIGQPGKESHKVDLGLYKFSSDLLDGLSTIDSWAQEHDYVTLKLLRERLEKSYNSKALNYDLD